MSAKVKTAAVSSAPTYQGETKALPKDCPASPDLFGTVRQIMSRLQSVGEILDTVSGSIRNEPTGQGENCKSPGTPSLQDLLDETARMAMQIENVANDLAVKIGCRTG